MSSAVTVARVGDVAIGRALGRQRDDGVDLDLRPRGSEATPIVLRAGGPSAKNAA